MYVITDKGEKFLESLESKFESLGRFGRGEAFAEAYLRELKNFNAQPLDFVLRYSEGPPSKKRHKFFESFESNLKRLEDQGYIEDV